MPEFLLDKGSVTLRPSDVAASGGEADIYRLRGEAYKVFKTPSHPEVKGQLHLEAEARARIAEHQQKLPLLIALAGKLSHKIALPAELLRDKAGRVAGYRMNFIDNAEVLLRYGERSFREQGVSDDLVRDVFVDLHPTVQGAHAAGLVFGDFNDLNVLVKGREAFVIDTDSAQFGKFPCRMFTIKFVDPLVCDPKGTLPTMIRPHNPETDWYAYLVMLMQSLLFVGPYGGVYRPKDLKLQLPHDARALKRITVFNPEVRYPKPARPYSILPDDLLNYFRLVFEKDKRGVPPVSLVENLRFTTCSKCGLVHARGVCPVCVGITPTMVKEKVTGTLSATKLFETSGRILFAAMQQGQLRYLYHHTDSYRREGDRTVVRAPLDPKIRFRIQGERSLFAKAGQCLIFEPARESPAHSLSVDAYGMLPLIDANDDHIFFAEGGGLYRSNELGFEYRDKVGDVLPNQTLFWVGDTLGFGFYRAAELSNFFVFEPARRGLNDSVNIPGIRGQLVDSTCCFGHKRVWFFTATQEGGKAVNRCHLLNERGERLGSAEGVPGDGTWLGHIRGACAVGELLLVPTDEGVVRVRQNGNMLGIDKEYPDTAEYVDANSHLSINKEGLHVVRGQTIWRLVMR
jgi:hypothetical protein